MFNLIIFSPLSSLAFSIIPYITPTPLHIKNKLYVLTFTSAMYHLHEGYKNKHVIKDTNNTTKSSFIAWYKYNIERITNLIELCDGIGIITVCNGFPWMGFSTYKNITTINRLLIAIYSYYKFKYDDELIKKCVYSFTAISSLYQCPRASIPFLLGSLGYINYLHTSEWTFLTRLIWHTGNTLYIASLVPVYFKTLIHL